MLGARQRSRVPGAGLIAFSTGEDLGAFCVAAEKALELNPNNPQLVASLGLHFVYAGKSERGLASHRHDVGICAFGHVLEYVNGHKQQGIQINS